MLTFELFQTENAIKATGLEDLIEEYNKYFQKPPKVPRIFKVKKPLERRKSPRLSNEEPLYTYKDLKENFGSKGPRKSSRLAEEKPLNTHKDLPTNSTSSSRNY